MRSITVDPRRLLAVALTTLLVASLSHLEPAQASDEPFGVLASGRNTTSQWQAYTIRSAGGHYRLEWSMDVEQDPLQIGAFFYTGDDEFRAGFTWTGFTYQESSHYELNVVPGSPIAGEPTIDADGYHQTAMIGGPFLGSAEEPKVTKILIWASGDLSGGSDWQLRTTPQAHLVTDDAGEVEMTSGTDAFVHLSQDFEGAAKAGVQRRVPPTPFGSGIGARAAAITSKTVEVEHALVGGFWTLGEGSPFSAQGYAMQVSGSNGYEQNCKVTPCSWYPLEPSSAIGPGTYRFDLSGGGAGIGTFGDAMLWGVDARLPTGGGASDPTPRVEAPLVMKETGNVNVFGQARFPGLPITTATDPHDDGAGSEAADVLGAELSGASVTYTREQQDLSLRFDLAPHESNALGTIPGILYAMEFKVGGTHYEVRVMKAAATSTSPSIGSTEYMALFRCAPDCTEQTRLSGAFSWPGRVAVYVQVPLSAISADEGSQLTDLRSYTAIGEASPGAVVPIDEVTLPSVSIPEARVELGIAPASTSESGVVFDVIAELSGGDYTASLPTRTLSTGDYRVWTRACMGVVCGPAKSVDLTV